MPSGYWNWLDLGDDEGPEAPDDVRKRLMNLQNIKGSQYKVYIDKIYEYAAKYDLQLYFELHGLPGSQNGEIHSGCVTGEDKGWTVWKPQHYFMQGTHNKDLALRAMEVMA